MGLDMAMVAISAIKECLPERYNISELKAVKSQLQRLVC